MIFLVQDGGHSIHEALWTANQVNKKLDLGFNLSNPKDSPLNFISDYNKFIDSFKEHNETYKSLKNAFEIAWSNTISYFEKIHDISQEKGQSNYISNSKDSVYSEAAIKTESLSPLMEKRTRDRKLSL